MTSRQLRRASEHKARKDAYKAQRSAEANDASSEIAVSAPAPATERAHRQTGPRTSEGKAISSQNARTHGLCSAKIVAPGEESSAYDTLLASLLDEHRPATPTETILVSCMADAWWQLERVRRHQHTLVAEGAAFDDSRSTLAHRYATTHERSFHRNLRMLQQLQRERLAQTDLRAAEFVFAKQ